MSFKRAKVVMLPTNEKAVFGFLTQKGKERGHLVHFDRPMPNILDSENQHLYFLSDDEIKVGDWCYDEYNKVIFQNNSSGTPGASKKIIATTDKNLIWLDKSEKNPELARPNGLWKCLPQPSEGFIQKFVDSYNSGNPITEVDVEYDCDRNQMPVKVIDILKVNPKDNTITIKKLKDSWSKTDEDLIKAFENFACDVYDANYGKDMSIRQRAEIMSKQWIEENL